MPVMKKAKLKKRNKQKYFDQETVVIQTLTTSKEYGYLLLSKFPLPKKEQLQISETLIPSWIGYPQYRSQQVCWAPRAFAAKHCAQHVCKGFSVASTCKWTATLYLFLEILANHFRVCLSSESAVKFSAR